MRLWIVVAWVFVGGSGVALSADPDSAEQQALEDWLNSDVPDVPSAAHVNEGHLAFLDKLPDKPVHFHQNTLWIDQASMESGWARLYQCHENLDPVGRLQITFSPERIADLAVASTTNVGQAWVEGPTVQVRDIQRGARLCLNARTLIVKPTDTGGYSVSNGPFMRRFLDGFYPMRVSMEMNYPANRLRVRSVSPTAQPGFEVHQQQGQLRYEARFEGRLTTTIAFDLLTELPPKEVSVLSR